MECNNPVILSCKVYDLKQQV